MKKSAVSVLIDSVSTFLSKGKNYTPSWDEHDAMRAALNDARAAHELRTFISIRDFHGGRYSLDVSPKSVSLSSADGTPNALSNMLDSGKHVEAEVAATLRACTSPEQVLAVVKRVMWSHWTAEIFKPDLPDTPEPKIHIVEYARVHDA